MRRDQRQGRAPDDARGRRRAALPRGLSAASYRKLLGTRWRLLAAVLPAVVVVGVAKIVVTELGAEDIELNPLYTGLVAGNIFLLGFLLAGMLSDYKETEKLPVELDRQPRLDRRRAADHQAESRSRRRRSRRSRHIGATVRLDSWLASRQNHARLRCSRRSTALNGDFAAVEPQTQPGYINRIKGEQNAVRRMLMRIHSIRGTSFVVAGFMVAALTSLLLITLLLFIDVGAAGHRHDPDLHLTFLLVYVLLLIRDLDDPFDYAVGRDRRLRRGLPRAARRASGPAAQPPLTDASVAGSGTGRRSMVRPIRPEDRDALAQAFERL